MKKQLFKKVTLLSLALIAFNTQGAGENIEERTTDAPTSMSEATVSEKAARLYDVVVNNAVYVAFFMGAFAAQKSIKNDALRTLFLAGAGYALWQGAGKAPTLPPSNHQSWQRYFDNMQKSGSPDALISSTAEQKRGWGMHIDGIIGSCLAIKTKLFFHPLWWAFIGFTKGSFMGVAVADAFITVPADQDRSNKAIKKIAMTAGVFVGCGALGAYAGFRAARAILGN